MARIRRASSIRLRYRTADGPSGVTRRTVLRIAAVLGVSETQVIHLALRNLALRVLSRYAADDGRLTDAELRRIRRRAGPVDTTLLRSSLFDPH